MSCALRLSPTGASLNSSSESIIHYQLYQSTFPSGLSVLLLQLMVGPTLMGLACLSRRQASSMDQPRARTHDPAIRTGGEVKCRMLN